MEEVVLDEQRRVRHEVLARRLPARGARLDAEPAPIRLATQPLLDGSARSHLNLVAERRAADVGLERRGDAPLAVRRERAGHVLDRAAARLTDDAELLATDARAAARDREAPLVDRDDLRLRDDVTGGERERRDGGEQRGKAHGGGQGRGHDEGAPRTRVRGVTIES